MVRIPDSPGVREDVAAWVGASPPIYQVHPVRRPSVAEVAELGPFAPWSEPLDVEHAFSIEALALVRVLEVDTTRTGTRLRLETNFADADYSFADWFELEMAAECVDRRLLEVGRQWLMPMLVERNAAPSNDELIEAGAVVFGSGVLFELDSPAGRIHRAMARRLR